MEQEKVAVWLGIDWADQKHRWAMRIDGEARIQQGELEHTPEAVEQFVSNLANRFPGRRVAVALEQSRGALLFMLGKYEHLVLYPIHPNTVDHYRKSVYPSGAKSDPGDADLILDLLYKHTERYARSIRTLRRLARCSSWSKRDARPSTIRPVTSTG